MKTLLSILAVCQIYSSYSEAYRVIDPDANQIQFGEYSIPINFRVSPECAPVIQQVARSQLEYLDQEQAWLKQELALNQQNRALLIQISQQGRSVVQSNEEPEEVPNTAAQGIIPSILSKTGNVAGDIFKTAGQLAKDDIDLKAALIGGTLGGAGKAAASALHSTGDVAAHAASNIEDGFKNIFSNFGK